MYSFNAPAVSAPPLPVPAFPISALNTTAARQSSSPARPRWKSAKDWIRRAAYRSGLLSLWQRWRQRDTLTVVMFHRVLPRTGPEWADADHNYTVTTDQFAASIKFFARHYTVVSLAQVEAALYAGKALPPRALLITFDDGWADTLTHAGPLLQAAGMPAVCFVISSALDNPELRWWQSVFSKCWKNHGDLEAAVRTAWEQLDPGARTVQPPGLNAYLRSVWMLNDMPANLRRAWLAQRYKASAHAARDMLTPGEAVTMVNAGIAVGSHGVSHLPLPALANPDAELRGARERLEAAIAATPQKEVVSLCFPHGRYSDLVLQRSRAAGYKLMFCSIPSLIKLTNGCPSGDLFGRIEITSHHYANDDGVFEPERLAFHIFTRGKM